MLLHKKQGFQYVRHGIWAFFTNFAQSNTIKTLYIMDIKKSEFTISAATVSQCPKDTKPEFAFIGRSNVGKSSLINMLSNH